MTLRGTAPNLTPNHKMNATFLNYINVAPPIEKIYGRLGYTKGKTQLSPEDEQITKQYIDEALALITLKASITRVPVLDVQTDSVKLVSGITLSSTALAKLLSGCKEVLFMGSTAGSTIVETIQRYSSGENVTAAVVFDAVASEMTDAALDWLVSYFNNGLRRENKCLTKRRFSAGYADFALENQKLIYEILEMKKLGVSLTNAFLLVPEKSVTALVGIRTMGE